MNNTSKVKFKSLSGQVVFDKYGDSVRWSRIKQFQGKEKPKNYDISLIFSIYQ